MIDVVIARFNENVAWSNSINHGRYIYNKGVDTVHPEEIQLPNVGREAHTYLYHIVNKYHDLADHTLFLQGNPADHGLPDNLPNVSFLNNMSFNGWFIPLLQKKDEYNYLKCDEYGAPHHHLKIKQFACEHGLFDMTNITEFEFVQGAQFAVSRDAILSRSLSTYQHLLNTLSIPDQTINAHVMERIWKYLFNCY
jgi:hypothetical protein